MRLRFEIEKELSLCMGWIRLTGLVFRFGAVTIGKGKHVSMSSQRESQFIAKRQGGTEAGPRPHCYLPLVSLCASLISQQEMDASYCSLASTC